MSTPFDDTEPTRHLPYAPLDQPVRPSADGASSTSHPHADTGEHRAAREPGVTPEPLGSSADETGLTTAPQRTAFADDHGSGAGVNVPGTVVAALGVLVALACALTVGGVDLWSSSVGAVIVVAVIACLAGVLVSVRRRSR